MTMQVSVNLRGPMFTPANVGAIKVAIIEEAFAPNGSPYAGETFPQRIARVKKSGHILGRTRNTITTRRNDLRLTSTTTLIWPRTTGRAWGETLAGNGYSKGILPSMAPRILNAIAKRMVTEFS